MRTYNVTVGPDAYVRHDGVRYGPGSVIYDVDHEDAQRLESLGVGHVEVVEPELSPLEQLLAAKAAEAIEAIGATGDVELLEGVLEGEKRATVIKAVEERLAELRPPAPPAGNTGEGDVGQEPEELTEPTDDD